MKTIMVSDEAYRKLKLIKGGRSFTELLSEMADKLKPKFVDISEYAGIIGDEEAKELQKIARRVRKSTRVSV